MVPKVQEALHEIFVGDSAPVVSDFIGVFLALSGTAVRVQQSDCIALLGPDLRIPSVGPLGSPRSLRAAMNQEGQRVFLSRVVVSGRDHKSGA